MIDKNDQLYKEQRNNVSAFKFDQRVASVFTDMISRSVPGYSQILDLLPTLTRCFQFPKLHYYDLGCSLGAGMLAMGQGLEEVDCEIVGIDNSKPMLEQAKSHIEHHSKNTKPNYILLHENINTYSLQPAAMVLMNFTLQFISIENRVPLIDKIYASLVQGGVFILSEKVNFTNLATNSVLIDIHHQYKADQGYSKLEISQKRDAIENVLIPEPIEKHIERLHNAGFSIVTPWIQNLQFISILAIK